MRKPFSFNLLFIVFISFLFCVGCSNGHDSSSSSIEQNFSILLHENHSCYEITSKNPVQAKRGESVSFDIKLNNGIAIHNLLHQNEEVNFTYKTSLNKVTTITIPNIRYSASYTLDCYDEIYTITYYPNGGEYLDIGYSETPYQERYSYKNRLRPNTDIGTNHLKRDGYILNGWNTHADGTGERVGLGSRVSMNNDKTLNLYAIWEKESSLNDFVFHKESDGFSVNKYQGHESKVVVPSTYQNKPVVGINKEAFTGLEKAVVLPSSITYIKEEAFSHSAIKEIYLYDNIKEISDESFAHCEDFSTVHFNAILAPRFGKDNLYSEINLADKYDILVDNKDKEKIVAFGGSGAYISLDTSLMEKACKNDIICLNMAVNGWFNGVAQFEMIMPYLSDGDTFIHIPETSSQFGMMYSTSMTPEIADFTYNKLRFYSVLETNLDLISLIDFRHVTNLLTGFKLFNESRLPLAETIYEDYKTEISLYGKKYHTDLGYIDRRGNWILDKEAKVGADEAGEADIVVEYVTDENAHNTLNQYFSLLKDKGVNVYFANAGINRDTLEKRLLDPSSFDGKGNGHLYYGRPAEIPDPHYPSVEAWVDEYEQAVKSYLDVEVLIPLHKVLYHTDDYFEPDYHLASSSSEAYTNLFIDALKTKGVIR